MKAILALAALAGAGFCNVAEADATAARIAALKDSFRFSPVAGDTAATVADDDPTIMLERMTITESMSRRALARQIETRWATERLAEFHWATGGRLFTGRIRSSRAEYGLWPILEDRYVGSVTSTRLVGLKLEMLRVRW